VSYLKKCKMWWVWIMLLSTWHNQRPQLFTNFEAEHSDKNSRCIYKKCYLFTGSAVIW